MDDLLETHAHQIANYGGSEGLRDSNLLASAIAQPEASFAGNFLHADLYEMAAAYLFHIVSDHPFIDGNKRVGLEAA
jgi:death-on-curing protein